MKQKKSLPLLDSGKLLLPAKRKIMKAYLIDPATASIVEVEIYKGSNHYVDSISKVLECEWFERISRFVLSGDQVYADEDGLTNNEYLAFRINDTPCPVFGKALIIGANGDEDLMPPKLDIDKLRKNIQFYNREQTNLIRKERNNGFTIIPKHNANSN